MQNTFIIFAKDGNNVENEYEDPIRSLPDDDIDNNHYYSYIYYQSDILLTFKNQTFLLN